MRPHHSVFPTTFESMLRIISHSHKSAAHSFIDLIKYDLRCSEKRYFFSANRPSTRFPLRRIPSFHPFAILRNLRQAPTSPFSPLLFALANSPSATPHPKSAGSRSAGDVPGLTPLFGKSTIFPRSAESSEFFPSAPASASDNLWRRARCGRVRAACC